MAVLRFPNPVSDVPKFVTVFQLLYRNLESQTDFGQDDIVRVLIAEGQASSCGAIGELALERSTRRDRSRDPLYNQAKMYSELYRQLGWLHTGRDSGHFDFPGIAQYVARDGWPSGLIEESLYSIVFPNPYVESRGGHILRPFALLLKSMRELDGVMCRDEMIVAVLSAEDDRDHSKCAAKVEMVSAMRGHHDRLADALDEAAGGVQLNTVRNYTRFPLGVLRSTDWARPERNKALYGRSLTAYRLTEQGEATADRLLSKVDVRHSDLESSGDPGRAAFVLLAIYEMLGRAGYDITRVRPHFSHLRGVCSGILSQLGTDDFGDILYSPYQQAPKSDLSAASALDGSLG